MALIVYCIRLISSFIIYVLCSSYPPRTHADHLLAQQNTLYACISKWFSPGWGGEGVHGLIFAGYVPLASQSPYPIIVYSVANYRPHHTGTAQREGQGGL